MDKTELTTWALANGWQIIAGHPSLTKPSSPKEAIVRMVLKTTVVHIEAKKPAGKWEKVSGANYGDITPDVSPQGKRLMNHKRPGYASAFFSHGLDLFAISSCL